MMSHGYLDDLYVGILDRAGKESNWRFGLVFLSLVARWGKQLDWVAGWFCGASDT